MTPVIHCNGFSLTEALTAAVESKVSKISKRVTLRSCTTTLEKIADGEFRAHYECAADDEGVLNASAHGKDVYQLINEASDKVLRQISDIQGRHSHRTNRTQIHERLTEEEE